jgi:tRNA threonylcarbamoyladenosine modification (KEOPS) complex  Pcc1 subunit
MSPKKSSKRRQAKERPKQQPRTRAHKARAELTVEIGLPSTKLAETIYTTLLPEAHSQPRGFRSHVGVKKKDRVVTLNIEADDIVAMRAASNTYLRFVQVALKAIQAVSPFYRAAGRETESTDNLGKQID